MLIRSLRSDRCPPICSRIQSGSHLRFRSYGNQLGRPPSQHLPHPSAGACHGSSSASNVLHTKQTYISRRRGTPSDSRLPCASKAVAAKELYAQQVDLIDQVSGRSRPLVCSSLDGALRFWKHEEVESSTGNDCLPLDIKEGTTTSPKDQVTWPLSMQKRHLLIREGSVPTNTKKVNTSKRFISTSLHGMRLAWQVLKQRRTQKLRKRYTNIEALKMREKAFECLPFSLSPIKEVTIYPRRFLRRPNSMSRSSSHRPLERFYPFWSIAFSKIHSQYLPSPLATNVGQRKWRFRFERIAQKSRAHSQGMSSSGTLTQSLWYTFGPKAKRKHWISVLLFALHTQPRVVAHILQDIWTKRHLHIPAYIAEDCVIHVCSYFLKRPKTLEVSKPPVRVSKHNVEMCLRLVRNYLEYYTECLGSVSLDHHVIYDFLLPCLNEKQIYQLQDALQKSGARLKTSTVLKFIQRFLVCDRVDIALELLRTIDKADLSNQSVLETCEKILRAEPTTVANLYNVRSNILSYMLEIGIVPNRKLYDRMILNAIEAGDRHTAWSFHDICQIKGMEASAFTYSILLKGVEYGDDHNSISSIHRAAEQHNLASRSPVLAFSLIFATYQLLQRKYQTKRFDSMLSVYSQLFDVSLLQDIGIVSHVQQQVGLMKPNRPVLGCMISTWVRDNTNSAQIFQVFENILSLMGDRKGRIASITESPHVVNSFIKAFGQQRTNLGLCISIVQEMLKSGTQGIGSRLARKTSFQPKPTDLEILPPDGHPTQQPHQLICNNKGIKLPRADPYTWNILLHAFAEHNNLEAAEEILRLMKKMGVESNEVTWNQLMHAYTRLQDLPMVINTLERRQKAGIDPDEGTLNTLSKINDRTRLLELIGKASKGEVSHPKV